MIPLRTFNEPFVECTHTLSGRTYVFNYQYNERADRFFLTIVTEDGTPIVKGRKLLPGRNLLKGVATPARPPGTLLIVARGSRTDAPGFGELGDLDPTQPNAGQFLLIYLEPGEKVGDAAV